MGDEIDLDVVYGLDIVVGCVDLIDVDIIIVGYY